MMVLVLGLALVLVAIGVVALALDDRRVEAAGVTRSLEALEALSAAPEAMRADLDRPFEDRVAAPLRARALALGRRLTGASSTERIRRKLDYAGNPRDWSVDKVVSTKVIGALAMPVIALALTLLLGFSVPTVLLVVLGAVVGGFFVPDLYLYQKSYERSEAMQRELPDAIDLLTISVESGLGFDAAVQQVATNTEGPLSQEFARMLREMQIGSSRSAALRDLAERTSVADVKTFVGAMVQADAFGIPVGQVLRTQSGEMRVKRRQRAETKAQQVPVKMTIPLIFCILPTLFVAVMGPAAISIMDSFG